jgi:hypothetical protein
VIQLSDFDPEIVREYNITPRRLKQVLRYVQLMQGDDSLTLRDIIAGGHYGTSALLHEIAELDILLKRDLGLLRRSPRQAHRFFELNQDAHSRALAIEYRYLQRVILRCFEQKTDLGALLMANTIPLDFYALAESDEAVELLLPQETEIAKAEALPDRLRSLGKELC